MFFNSADFEFTQYLEKNWETIRAEVDELSASDYLAWPEKFLYDNRGWDVFALHTGGQRITKHCAMCPMTTAIVEQVPGLVTSGLSSIAPNTHIKPHQGPSDAVLRCHLGLIVPPDTGLRVGEETRPWEEGKSVIFDDTYEHETWNRSNKTRIILWLEFLKKVPTSRHEPAPLY